MLMFVVGCGGIVVVDLLVEVSVIVIFQLISPMQPIPEVGVPPWRHLGLATILFEVLFLLDRIVEIVEKMPERAVSF